MSRPRSWVKSEGRSSVMVKEKKVVDRAVSGGQIITLNPRPAPPGSDRRWLRPYTGMTIKLTPELLSRLVEAGHNPRIQLTCKDVTAGGVAVLVVDGDRFVADSHLLEGGTSSEGSKMDQMVRIDPKSKSMTTHASFHKKLIVRQVLSQAKKDEMKTKTVTAAAERKTPKTVALQDDDHALAATTIPNPSRTPSMRLPLNPRDGATAGSSQGAEELPGSKRKRQEGDDADEKSPELTVWVGGFRRDDDHTGLVPDIKQFFRGLDVKKVLIMYTIDRNGRLRPNRHHICVKFKTEGARDLAVARSGETFGPPDSRVAVTVMKGLPPRAEGPDSYLLVLPNGRSVKSILTEAGSVRSYPSPVETSAAMPNAAQSYCVWPSWLRHACPSLWHSHARAEIQCSPGGGGLPQHPSPQFAHSARKQRPTETISWRLWTLLGSPSALPPGPAPTVTPAATRATHAGLGCSP
ncbi:unnamed protein product [Discosporangium mesarthrocarpum]